MQEQVYSDVDIRYFSKDYCKIPMTFLSTGYIPAGTVVGQKADGYGHKVRRTTLTNNAAAGANELVVADATLFKVGDVVGLMKADGSAVENLGAVTNIIVADNKVVVTTAVTAAHAAGSYAYVADGSQKALAILSEPVIDEGIEVVANVYIGGCFNENMVSGLDTIARTDLGARTVTGILIVPGC